MTWTVARRTAASVFLLVAFVLGVSLLGGCGALDVSDPTIVEAEDLSNGTGANLLRRDALFRLADALSDGALGSGIIADEFFVDPAPAFVQGGQVWRDELLDRRTSQQYEDVARGEAIGYEKWQRTRRAATIALDLLRAYMPEPPRSAYIGQMFAVRGFATLRLAEDFCSGFPLDRLEGDRPVHSPPRTVEEAFNEALVDFDSAVVYAADSTRFLQFARVGRARTLLGLGRFAEAAAAVALVPTDFVWNAEYSWETGPVHALAFTLDVNNRHSVANLEGGTGLDFVAAEDPRVDPTPLGPGYDEVTQLYATGKYQSRDVPIVLANGVEARLIEAEAALRANPNDPQWLNILNELRRNWVTPALADTTDPGTGAARVDLLFRERAFWLFGTGHRLGDLRRLVAHYQRDSESVFPTGAYRLGGVYGTGTSIPFSSAVEGAYNPAVTGCIAR